MNTLGLKVRNTDTNIGGKDSLCCSSHTSFEFEQHFKFSHFLRALFLFLLQLPSHHSLLLFYLPSFTWVSVSLLLSYRLTGECRRFFTWPSISHICSPLLYWRRRVPFYAIALLSPQQIKLIKVIIYAFSFLCRCILRGLRYLTSLRIENVTSAHIYVNYNLIHKGA